MIIYVHIYVSIYTWGCIDIFEESINVGRAYIFVNKELQRVSRDALE